VRAIAREFDVDAGQLSRWARGVAKPDAPGRGKLMALGIEFPWWEEEPLAAELQPFPLELDEVTPAEAPIAKRQSSAPPPLATELVDATDVDDETTASSELPLESTPNLPPVKLSERNVRTDTNPDPRAGEYLEPTPKPLTALDVEVPERVTVLDEEDRTPTPSPDGF
jgi:transposase-like protein